MLTWWCHTLGMSVLAVFLLARGLRGRWVGGEPRCRRCCYQLTGVESSCCPECGLEFDEFTVNHGIRKRRWGSVVVACLLPIAWIQGQRLMWTLRTVNWNHYYPVSVVLKHAAADESVWIEELERRIRMGGLSEDSLANVTDLALDKVRPWSATQNRSGWSHVIQWLEHEDLFSYAQREFLFSQFDGARLVARPVIRQGDFVVAEYYRPTREPEALAGYQVWHRPTKIEMGAESVFVDVKDHWWASWPDWCVYGSGRSFCKRVVLPIGRVPVGEYPFYYAAQETFLHPRRGRGPDRRKDRRSWIGEVVLSGKIEILPAEGPDPVRWDNSPVTASELREIIVLKLDPWDEQKAADVAVLWVGLSGGRVMNFVVGAEECSPVNLAFEVVVEAEGQEVPARFTFRDTRFLDPEEPGVVIRAGEASSTESTVIFSRLDAEEIYIVLQASREVARQTVDLYEIWQGELRYGPFGVVRPDEYD